MALLRAYYDGYTRERLRLETRLEAEANDALIAAPGVGSAAAMDRALTILAGPPSGCCPEWRRRIEALCAALFESIGLQTSVPRYGASGYERGAVLDFVDHPLNNRWWLEDEFARIRALGDEAAKRARLETIRTWAQPGPGSFYDDIGNIGASPRVARSQARTSAGDAVAALHVGGRPEPQAAVVADQPALARRHRLRAARSRRRATMVRLHVITNTAAGQVRLRIDGEPAQATGPGDGNWRSADVRRAAGRRARRLRGAHLRPRRRAAR